MKKIIILLITFSLVFIFSSCRDNSSNPIQVDENNPILNKAASQFVNIQFKGRGEVINSNSNSDGTYSLLCKIYFDVKMDNGQIAKGGGNLIIPAASVRPISNFKIRGNGEMEFTPKNSNSEWNIIDVNIDIQNGRIKKGRKKLNLAGAKILGLMGMLEGGK